jgi:hypothetical protein
MWKKNNIEFKNPLLLNGRKIFNPTAEQLIQAGYSWQTNDNNDTNEDDTIQKNKVKKYSTLKIIRVLGDIWVEYRNLLEINGILDQFFAANYLSEDDPVFIAFLANVPDEIKEMLDQCIWDEN